MAQCLMQVKTTLGADAVILHTREVQQRKWLGLRRFKVVEITAGNGVMARRRARSDVATDLRRPAPPPPQQPPVQHGTAHGIAVMALNKEMETIKGMIKDLTVQIRHGHCPDVPEALFDHYRCLIENRVADELARDIITSIKTNLRQEHLANTEYVREKIIEVIEKLIPTAGPITRRRATGAHVVALIGPTGVGKTTTIAKLAAHLQIRDKQRVALITMDTYRIAAVEQLRRFADILNAPLKVVVTPEEMQQAVAQLQHFDYILIDTAGRGPRDTLRLNELRSFLAAANVDETHLVVSSTSDEGCVELAIERFGAVKFDKLIFTKIDEASQMGVLFNVIRKVNKSISYITTGQDVPEDIEVGRGRRLAQLILEKNA